MLFMPCFWKIVINLSLNYPSSIRWPEDHISLSTRTQVSNVKSCGSSHLSAGLTLNGTNIILAAVFIILAWTQLL